MKTLALCIGLAASSTLFAADDALHLSIGDPARRDREVPLVLDAITDTATGVEITPQALAERLAGVGILFVGESHTDQDFHDVQLRVIRALHEAGREVLIGLEMFPYTAQAVLDDWIAGRYTEASFVETGRWYEHWGYHWNYYREIFRYAREQGLGMYAVNSPRELVRTVRAKGFESLSPEERAHLPPQLASESEEHRRMYRAFFDPGDALHMNEEALEGLYRAQTMWDATMGWNALQALREHGGKDAIMVVLIGSGHVTYGLGSERQIDPHYDGRIASLVPVTVVDDDGEPVTSVRASYASFVWGLPAETYTVYPSLGVSLMGSLGKEPGQIIQVSGDSAGARAGLAVGDVLLALDGTPIDSDVTLRKRVADYRWGDAATAHIRRDGKEQDVTVKFRRPGR
jgi:uncharacterized iron-regulated protein